ncbi:efflux RND transporter periplasmic adaptor subunit [Thalassospira sp. TSL5-1]|uniref:efflux RND transporter periplasmic adaptor subunit n=1 Tax=Thalassospira sp. TSL5-1 TaxID=1544451 RepID=UPI00093A2EB5|nr:efflux RND transporter periplasmic adaptor subunit [Thalassospira sp. TSL5-1]OKH88369.1 RND transporter [Thalassospira sp. TSL5-1]
MNASRLIAIALVVGAALWIGSSMIPGAEPAPAQETAATAAKGAADNGDPSQTAAPLPSVRVMASSAQDHVRHLVQTGSTEAATKSDIRAQTSSRIIEIAVEKGATVKKGDMIVRLAADDRPARLEKARALVDQRELEYDAAKSLAKKDYRSKTGVAESKAALEEARADLKAIEVELTQTTIRAPFDGVIETRPAEMGDLVSVGDIIATIVQPDPMLVVAHIPEHSIGALHVGQLAHVRLFDGRTRQGVVRYTAIASNNDTRTYRIEVEMDNADHSIPDGMTAELVIPVGTDKAHQIASSSLTLNDQGELGVRGVEQGKVVFYPVSLQGGDREKVWVSGLPEKIDLIVVGQDWVKEGTNVTIDRIDHIPTSATPATGTAKAQTAEASNTSTSVSGN